MQISCKPSCSRPQQPTFHSVLWGRCPGSEPGTVRLVGCICGLGATAAGSPAGTARLRSTLADDARERPQRTIHGRGIREHCGHVRLQHDDVAAGGHTRRIGIPAAFAKVVFRQNVVRTHAGGALSGLLHIGDARDESLSER